MKGLTRGFLSASVAGLAVGFVSPALAQDGEGASAGAISANEIVVTANKREQSLKDVGLSITAVSGDELAERKITSLEDVAAIVPGLAYAASTANTPIYTLRGVGFNESSLGVYPAVSVYVDQAPLPFPVLASHSAYDLERVEVLKGPQGTLFGQNSTGGAINYIAAKPKDYFEAGGDISYGRFNAIEGNAFISGPLAEGLRGRVAVTGANSDGWQYSVSRPEDRNGALSYVAGRLLLDADVGDSVKLSLNVNGWRDKSEPQAQQLIGLRAAIPGATAAEMVEMSVFSPDKPRAADWSSLVEDPATGVQNPDGSFVPGTASDTNFAPRSDRRMWQASLRGDIEVGGGITITSLTSYVDYDQEQTTDGDGNWLVTFDLIRNDGAIESFVQELRIANDPASRFRWLLGANYEDSKTVEDQLLRYFDNSNYDPANLYINGSAVTNRQSIRNIAGFASVEFDVSDMVTLKAAGRYTDSRNRANICSYTIPGGNVDILFNILGGMLGTTSFDPIGPDDCYTLNENLVPGEPFRQTLSEENFSWRVGADFKPSDDLLLYANVSRGYKAGSFPSLAAASFNALQPVTQEQVTAYELGVKSTLMDGLANFNAAAFYYDYRDKQIRGKLVETPNIFGPLDTLANVPKSEIKGFEADLTLRPADGLTIGGAVTYLDSKVKTGPVAPYNYNILGEIDDFHGDPLPFTPKWSGSVNVDYRHGFAGGGEAFAGFTVTARTKTDSALGGSRLTYPEGAPYTVLREGVVYPFQNKGYATVDARLGYQAADEAWRVMFWGKNIFNEYYWNAVIPANDSAARFAGKPATYGVTFGFRLQ